MWPLSTLWQLHLSCTWNNPSLEEVEAAEWTCFSGSFLDGEAYSKLQTLYLVLHGSSQHMTLRSHWDSYHQQSKYLQGVENFCCERRIAVLLLTKVQHLPLLQTFHTQVSSGLNISRNLRYWGVWWKQIVSIVAKISSVVLREDVTWTVATSTVQREVGTFRGWIATSEATATAAQLLLEDMPGPKQLGIRAWRLELPKRDGIRFDPLLQHTDQESESKNEELRVELIMYKLWWILKFLLIFHASSCFKSV